MLLTCSSSTATGGCSVAWIRSRPVSSRCQQMVRMRIAHVLWCKITTSRCCIVRLRHHEVPCCDRVPQHLATLLLERT